MWEGLLNSLKWVLVFNYYNALADIWAHTILKSENYWHCDLFMSFGTILKVNSLKRIGPHNIDVISLIIGSTLGKRYISSAKQPNKLFKLTKLEKEKLILSTELRETLIGVCLGDAHLNKRFPTWNTKVMFEQGKVHEAYALHLFELFKSYCSSKPQYSDRKADLRTGKIYSRIMFQTRSLPCFNDYRAMFYNSEGIKCIPSNIGENLTARGLAFWSQDDGFKAGSGFRLRTHSYSKKDVLLLIDVLKNNFDLNCSIHTKEAKNQSVIYIRKDSMGKFRSLVSPYFHESMNYKLLDTDPGSK